MPRTKAPAVLQAADEYRRAEKRVVACEKALEKAKHARTAAETAYFDLVAQSLAARRRASAPPGEEVSTPPA